MCPLFQTFPFTSYIQGCCRGSYMGKPSWFNEFSFMPNLTEHFNVVFWLQWLNNSGTNIGEQVQGQEIKPSFRLFCTVQNYTLSCTKWACQVNLTSPCTWTAHSNGRTAAFLLRKVIEGFLVVNFMARLPSLGAWLLMNVYLCATRNYIGTHKISIAVGVYEVCEYSQ